MDRATLEQLGQVLAGLPSGGWLAEQLVSLGSLPRPLRLLLLVSARQQVRKAAPEGLVLSPDCVVWDAPAAPDPALVSQTDLVLWAMTAIQMFPGEYASVLEQVRRARIPLWGIVLGMALLDPAAQEAFLRQDVRTYEAMLPPHSAILIYNSHDGPSLREVLRGRLEREGTLLSERGASRQRLRVAQQLGARIRVEHQQYTEALSQGTHYTLTARQGIAALKIMILPTVQQWINQYQGVARTLSILQKAMQMDLSEPGGARQGPPLHVQVAAAIGKWRAEIYAPAVNRVSAESEDRIRQWAIDYSDELRAYFGGFTQDQVQQLLGDATLLDPTKAVAAIAPILQRLVDQLLVEADQFAQRVQQGIGVEEVSPQPPWTSAERHVTAPGATSPEESDLHVGSPTAKSDDSGLERIARAAMWMVGDVIGVADPADQVIRSRAGQVVATELERLRRHIGRVIHDAQPDLVASLEGLLDVQSADSLQIVAGSLDQYQGRLERVLAAERLLGGQRA